MEFIRENLLKIIMFIGILIIALIIFTVSCGREKKISTDSYSGMEEALVSSAKRYVNNNKKLLPKPEEVSKINLDTLVNSKYINELYALEDSNVKCSGYVQIRNNDNNYIYIPYLKCGKYYETKTIADYILSNTEIVTSGDGLYNIGNSFVYRGENPKNYLTIGDRLYRIIEINGQELKLISQKRLDKTFVWDDRYNTEKDDNIGINDYSKSRLKESLNAVINTNKTDNNDEVFFSDLEKNKIIPHDICIGKRSMALSEISSSNECQKIEPNQKLSLITVSDYARASIDTNCKTIFDKSCMNYNYFTNINNILRTITALSDNSYQVFYINDGVAQPTRAASTFTTYIVVYINELSLYSKGDGSLENPYIIR